MTTDFDAICRRCWDAMKWRLDKMHELERERDAARAEVAALRQWRDVCEVREAQRDAAERELEQARALLADWLKWMDWDIERAADATRAFLAEGREEKP